MFFNKENGSGSIHPKEGIDFFNCSNLRSGMVEPIVEIFKTHGFNVWGGSWNTPIDYQHFQASKPTMRTNRSSGNRRYS